MNPFQILPELLQQTLETSFPFNSFMKTDNQPNRIQDGPEAMRERVAGLSEAAFNSFDMPDLEEVAHHGTEHYFKPIAGKPEAIETSVKSNVPDEQPYQIAQIQRKVAAAFHKEAA